MVKSGQKHTKYQKFLKSEKSKVKLKSKELPKGTNITKTNFKVKKIVIKEQLKEGQKGEAVTSRKLNLKDLLSRLNHFNTSAKNDAINGVKELLVHRSDVLDSHIDQLIRGVVPLVMDIEKTTRRESYKVLHMILTSTPPENLEPFFEILLSYLRCAMTHINPRIQEDSLLFLDVLLISAPQHVVSNYRSVMPNFIDMISKLRIDSKPGRMLTVNLDSKLTSVRWRVKVLNRLHDFLSILVRTHKNDATQHSNTTVYYDEKAPFYSIYDASALLNNVLPCYSAQRNNTDIETSEAEAFRSYVEVLLPLLFETWLEVGPGNAKTDSTLPEEPADLLAHILEVLQLLLIQVDYLKSDDLSTYFVATATNSFTQHILAYFPYNRRNKKVAANSKDEKMLNVNLTICNIHISLNKETQGAFPKSVLQYLEKNIVNFSSNENLQKKFISVLEVLFMNKKALGERSDIESLLNSILLHYDEGELDGNLRQQYFSLFCNLFLSDIQSLCITRPYQKWLKTLPNILKCENITLRTIDILNRFAVQRNKEFNNCIKGQIPSIVLNLPTIHNALNDKCSKYRLLSLLYWVNKWDNESLNLLQKQMENNDYGENHNFIVQILEIKTQK